MGEGVRINSDAVERSLTALSRPGTPGSGLMDALEHVLRAACELFGASGAGFMMLNDGERLSGVAATDPAGELLEQRQEQVGHGPCVDAVTLDQVTVTRDLADDHRWPELRPGLVKAGVRAVLGVPIRASGVAVGSLNVYRDHPHDWDESEISALTAYAPLIERLLLAALQAREQEILAQQLQHALDHRVVIERAVGVVMARERVDAVTAFNRLRQVARSAERKVADVAEELLVDIVEGRLNSR